MSNDTPHETKEWHNVWHKTYLKGEIEAYIEKGIPSRKETVNIISVYLHSRYINKIDVESILIDIATSGSFKWDEDSRLRFKLLKKELGDMI